MVTVLDCNLQTFRYRRWKEIRFPSVDVLAKIMNANIVRSPLVSRERINNKFRSIVICFVVICQFYLKMADDASSSSGCAGNLVDNSINQDELIMKQQREIEKEVNHTFHLVWSISDSEFRFTQP